MIQSSLSRNAELYRLDVQTKLDPKRRSALGQFMTPTEIARFMAGLFENFEGEIRLLDPGAGVGALTAAFVDELAIRNIDCVNAKLVSYEIEEILLPYLEETVGKCKEEFRSGIAAEVRSKDFIVDATEHLNQDLLSDSSAETFTHILMNPPYKKINSGSLHRQQLRSVGIETTNLYTAFMALSIKLLEPGGELVAIVPRSFCNGPYFLPFREQLLSEMAIKQVHVFGSRSKAFKDDAVLQENVIFHAIKAAPQGDVVISSTQGAAFHLDEESNQQIAEDLTERTIPYELLVSPEDSQKFIHLAPSTLSQNVATRINAFDQTLTDLGIKVSTGPVVDFRLRDSIHKDPRKGSVPLLYSTHLSGGAVEWPKEGRKPNAISPDEHSTKWLMPNKGSYVLTRRFTSKEEKKRLVATVYDGDLPGDLIGFENHLNVFHDNGSGMSKEFAHGLGVFLNSTLLDQYFREFNGHTQVNATDIRALRYPNKKYLEKIGRKTLKKRLDQNGIDELLEKELQTMIDSKDGNPLIANKKIQEAQIIIQALGLPRAQQNERSALTLLALVNLPPDGTWAEAERPLIGITPIMEFCDRVYGKQYAPNTRETFRRQTMHQFVDGAVALYNPDEPSRAVNSPKTCYQIGIDAYDVVLTYGTKAWDAKLSEFLESKTTLVQQYAQERDMEKIPVVVADGTEIVLTPGIHSQLIRDVISEFGPRFAPGSEVIYVGDTGEKVGYFQESRLTELGVTVDRHGKMPDVVLYFPEKDWLLLIEAVTSHGPVDGKRHGELKTLFAKAKPGLVYVTTFPDRASMGKYLSEISWETEVWVAEAPTHMIHFNGDRFLGPHPESK